MSQQQTAGALTHLRSGGVSLVLDSRDRRLPCVHFWGPELGLMSEIELDDLAEAARPPLRDSELDIVPRVERGSYRCGRMDGHSGSAGEPGRG